MFNIQEVTNKSVDKPQGFKSDLNTTRLSLDSKLKATKQQSNKLRDLTKTKNLHKNFQDLKPIYDQKKYLRAVDLADNWLDKIGDKLLSDVKKERRKNFVHWIQEGNKLSFAEIQNLGKTLKGDYTAQILKEDDDMNAHLAVIMDQILNKHDEVS